MGVTVKLLVEAQLFENKNWGEDTPIKRWRPKGAVWFQVEVDSEDLMYSETETILTEMVANYSKNSDRDKFEYLSHHEIFGGIWTLSSDEFARINERLHEEVSMGKAIEDEEENLREIVNDIDPAGGYGLHSHE